MKPVIQFTLLLALLGLAACAQDTESAADGAVCNNPRPEMCTRDYRPVCGLRDTGVRCVTEPCPSTEHETYGNACEACADGAVRSYRPGICESE
jgi:hypothetical protein